MAKKVGLQCVIEGCQELQSKRSQTGLCITCYNGMYYWRNRSIGDIMHRQRQLTKLANRMELLGPNQKRSKL